MTKEKKCKCCGKNFTNRGNHHKWEDRKFCSRKCAGYKRGIAPWNTGLHIKSNDALKIYYESGGNVWNKGSKGIVKPNKGSFKKGKNCGDKHWNWKGGKNPRRIYKYRKWREFCLKRDGFRCVLCGSTDRIHVDHIKPFTKYQSLRYKCSNGRTLCMNCHIKTQDWGNKKLTLEEIKEIRNLKKENPLLTEKRIGEKFGVTQSCIHLILKGKNWKWVK